MITYPNDWNEFNITEVANTFIGLVTTMTTNYSNKGVRLIRNSDIKENKFVFKENIFLNKIFADENKSRIHQVGDIITVHTGDIGTSSVIDDSLEGSLGFATIVTRVNNNIVDPYYLSWYFNSKIYKQYAFSIMTGDGRNNLNMKDFNRAKFFLPSLDEQKAISNVLSDFDEHIDNLTELIEKKKAIREGALEDLVSGRIRVDGFAEDWIKVKFDEVIIPKARIGWQGLKKEEYLTSGYSYLIGGGDFDDGSINLDTISYVTKERFEMDSNIQVESNNVLVTKDGTIGKVALVPVIDKPATLNSGVFVFKTNESLIPTFLYRVLLSSIFRKFIDTLSAGSTIKHLYQKDLKKFSFYMPKNLDEQKAISSILMDIDDEIKDLESEKDKMIQIREGAMNDLLTGRVRLWTNVKYLDTK